MMGNGGTGGFADDGVGGTGSERECILEVGDVVVRRKGTVTGLIVVRRSRGEVYEEIGSGGSGGGGSSCETLLCDE